MSTENWSSPVCWFKMPVTWLLSAEIFSKAVLEKKEMLPFLVYTFCACDCIANKSAKERKKKFFMW